ncbi:hypothetical protein SUGI_0610970 [Cryptomeria japonica]|nr:hypothetical protein SUGI_0610970 [Cryptomeria japonica]
MSIAAGTFSPCLLNNGTLYHSRRFSFPRPHSAARFNVNAFKVKSPGKVIQDHKENAQWFASGQWKLDTSFKFFRGWSLCGPEQSRHKVPIKRRVGTYSSAVPEGEASGIGLKSEQELQGPLENPFKEHILSSECGALHQSQNVNGKAGFVSFYGATHQHLEEEIPRFTASREGRQSLVWLLGPIFLVATVVFPPFFLRKVFEALFEDSLLTDFLILFFMEAVFYGGVAAFLLVTDYVQKPCFEFVADKRSIDNKLYGYRVVSIATLVLSVLLPLVSLGLVWPWTGPAASAAIAPYLVGLIVQFAFEQYVQRRKSCVWTIVPIVFQVYRLHQLNRASQLVGGLMFTLRGVESSPQTMAINGSLTTLLNVLQVLGIICLWSMTTFMSWQIGF